MKSFEGKVALVTGAGKGLGQGIAIALAQRGAKVIVNTPPFDADAAQTVQAIDRFGGQATVLVADVSDEQAVDGLFTQLMDRFGRLDILVNNAGTSQAKDIFEVSADEWKTIIDTNLSSGFHCSKKAMQIMKQQRSGRVVFVSSMVAHQGALFGHVHYAASKSGQLGLMKTLARTGAQFGVTVNAVAPGIIETDLLVKTHGAAGVAKLAQTVPLGLGKTEDVGHAVAFLCSDEARYITGATLDVNGGAYLR